MFSRRFFLLLGLAVALPWAALAQDATGRVIGTVTDPTGAAVPGANVTVTNTATQTSRATATDREGNYQVLQVPIGPYLVRVEAAGFSTAQTEASELRINQSLRFDVHLQLGATRQVVEVGVSAAQVETVDSSLGGSVTNEAIVNMPLNGRNVMDLIGLQAGATEQRGDSQAAGGYSISGGRTDSVAYLLDGTENNNLVNNGLVFNPNPDTIEEFRVLTSNGNAEYGRNAGGIVNAVVKSGTNELHGTAYDYLRNDDFNANKFFFNEQGEPRPVLKRNQFGGTIGGPIVIPHVVNGHDKLFFFFGYQGQRQSDVLTQSAFSVMTPEELQGNFSHASNGGPDQGVAAFLQAYPQFQPDPAKAAQAIIDPTQLSAVALNYIKAGLIPSAASGVVYPAGAETVNNNELIGKVDLNVTEKDHVSVTLGGHRAPSVEPFSLTGYGSSTPGLPYSNQANTYLANVAYTKIFSPTLLNEFRIGAQRINQWQGVPLGKQPTPADLGMAITPDLPTGPPWLDFFSGLTVGAPGQGPTNLVSTTYNLTDNLSWTHGHHTLKTGFNLSMFQNNMTYDYFGDGGYFFYGPVGWATLNDFADFMMGLPNEFMQYPNAPTNIRSKSYSGFVQDEWRVTPHLVLTLGLRYEYSQPKYDTKGRTFSLALGQQSTVFVNAPAGLLFPGDAGAPTGANFPDKNNFAPRFGFAWSPGDNKKTSIRGGFGVFYDILKAEDNLQFNGQAPFFSSVDFQMVDDQGNPLPPSAQALADPYGYVGRPNPFPSKPPTKNIDFGPFLPFGGNGVYVVNPHLRTPYVYQYNLTVERELANNLILEAAYVGNSSHKLTGLVDANPFVPGAGYRLFNTSTETNFNYLLEFANVGTGNYNSLQVTIQKKSGEVKYLGHADFQLSYTYGHEIDTESGFRENNAGQVPTYDPGYFRASGDEDIRHAVAFNAVWELPFEQAFGSLPKRLTKGWSLASILSWRTGFPLDVMAGLPLSTSDPGPSGYGDGDIARADLVGSGVTLYNPRTYQALNGTAGNYWFNPGNFSSTPTPPYGTLGRNAFRGPGRFNLDVSLSKETPLFGERVRLKFQADAFNVLNHAQWSDPNQNINSGLFGQITDTYDPRILQLAVRLQF